MVEHAVLRKYLTQRHQNNARNWKILGQNWYINTQIDQINQEAKSTRQVRYIMGKFAKISWFKFIKQKIT